MAALCHHGIMLPSLWPGEVEVVQRIYKQFITDGKVESEIAAGLNAQGTVTDHGDPGTGGRCIKS